MQPWQCLRRFALAWWERTAEGSARSPREEAGPRDHRGRGEPGLQRAAGGKPAGLCSLCLKSPDPERSSPPMLSADDAEYPREYRTLGGGGSGGRRFSNVGLVHTSERRHTVIAAQSLEALSGLQKADADRKRDAFMDHLKSKYPQHALALRGQQDRMREQVGGWTVDPACLLSSLCSHLHGDSAPSGAGQPAQQPNYWSFKTRSSRHTQGAQPGLADQAAKLSYASAESLETMSEAELPLGFSRMNRFRQSLPLSRSASGSSTAGAPPSELFPGPGERPLVGYGPPLPAKDSETRERMEAMEKQIASLTGLVQSALLRGSEPETPSEKMEGANGAATPSAREWPLLPQPGTQALVFSEPQFPSLLNDNDYTTTVQCQGAGLGPEGLRGSLCGYSDLEKSVEKIQREVSHSHRLVPGPELEEKALVLKQLGETLTELKAHFPGLQSKMRVVLRVEVEAVKFLKEEPQRLDGLLKRCRGVTDTLAQIRRQVDEGVWPPPNSLLNQSPKKMAAETDFNKSLDFEMPPPSPPLNLHELSGPAEGVPLTPKGGNPTKGLDIAGKRSMDKAVSVEAAERDWEEKRAALTQYSAKDINRLLEETQAELLKAIPDLDCASKAHAGPLPTPDHKPPKAPHGQKAAPRTEPSGRRGSDELTVPRYRTEKPSKSPPPPPPRRSFPSSHGLTTTRTGEVVVTSKKDSTFIKKAESEELEVQKPQVKLRRTVSEVARPASTPPIMASAIKDEDDEDRIIAELESGGGSVPPMKMAAPAASRLKAAQGQAGSPDKGKHGKQRAEYMRIQAQQQATKPSKEMSGSIETSSPVSEKPSASRTSIPVLTSFGARNSSISF
ncbi:LOW QUALITY PROTEIN: SRC kinase signaling inhibitor 1 [Echinops telfairi]|uniref:LOW QUALITY PROTEIN: SRC kinase signaling inhibitor 1 n=1 Tax=Echinops telfairi TaxID=9371 RepID=A0AC55DU44_ECHTE|nr:LOW QUALITY PROTEIN: SRC kinase signaling inhibitor 1 [Echinops telfairi]